MSNSKTYRDRASLHQALIASLCLCLSLYTQLFAQWSTDPTNNLIVGFGLLPEIASDGAGGCYVTYEQNLAYPRRLILERLDRYGYKPWGTNRRILGEFPEQWDAKITEDGHTGAIVSYSDRWADTILAWRVRVQRVDSSGNLLWGLTGARVSLSETYQGNQVVVSDGEGGCIVAWTDRDTISEEFHLRINRINSAGIRGWGDSGKLVWNYGYQSPGRPAMVADGQGGCYLRVGSRGLQRFDPQGTACWQSPIQIPTGVGIPGVDRDANLLLLGSRYIGYNGQIIYSIHLQMVDTSGALLWDTLGVTLDTLNTNLFLNYGLSTQLGYSTIAWPQDTSGVWDLRTQVVRTDGTTLFPFGGIPISLTSSQKGIVGVLPSDSLTSVYIWIDNRTPFGTYAQRLDTLGAQRWDTNDVVVSFSQPLDAVTDGNGGFIAIVGGQNFAVRAQQVNKHGQLGQVITSAAGRSGLEFPEKPILYQNYPNPFNPQTTIRFDLPRATHANLTLYNLLGQRVKVLVSGYAEAGLHSVILDGDDLPSGTYFYRLTAPKAIQTQKLVIVK